jgi:alpha-D-ribose 1-methylphosphonate 5-triphosphate synthase subunit PhnG
MEQLADRLDAAADLLTTVDRAVPGLVVPAGSFAADDAGLPGRLGRDLHAHWAAVLDARSQEAAAAAARLADLAQSVRAAQHAYAATDADVARRAEGLRGGGTFSA